MSINSAAGRHFHIYKSSIRIYLYTHFCHQRASTQNLTPTLMYYTQQSIANCYTNRHFVLYIIIINTVKGCIFQGLYISQISPKIDSTNFKIQGNHLENIRKFHGDIKFTNSISPKLAKYTALEKRCYTVHNNLYIPLLR